LLSDVFDIRISLGAIIACEQRTSAAVAAPVAEAAEYVQQQAMINAGEAGWREGARRAWLGVAVTAQVTVFLIHARRG
jgi:transposase